MKEYILVLMVVVIVACTPTIKRSNNIVVIGDSNGASPIGWVVKLDSILQSDSITNFSIGGNTIGFDNNGQERLNALKNIQKNLSKADEIYESIDLVVVALGTNDCKAVFDSLLFQVPNNMRSLISEIQNFPYKSGKIPDVLIVSPPEVANDSILLAKYHGISSRLDYLIPELERVSSEKNCTFLNLRDGMKKDFELFTEDGIHFNELGYFFIAKEISRKLDKGN